MDVSPPIVEHGEGEEEVEAEPPNEPKEVEETNEGTKSQSKIIGDNELSEEIGVTSEETNGAGQNEEGQTSKALSTDTTQEAEVTLAKSDETVAKKGTHEEEEKENGTDKPDSTQINDAQTSAISPSIKPAETPELAKTDKQQKATAAADVVKERPKKRKTPKTMRDEAKKRKKKHVDSVEVEKVAIEQEVPQSIDQPDVNYFVSQSKDETQFENGKRKIRSTVEVQEGVTKAKTKSSLPLQRSGTLKSEIVKDSVSGKDSSLVEIHDKQKQSVIDSDVAKRKSRKERGRRTRASRRTVDSEMTEDETREKDPFDIEGVVHLIISPEMQIKLGCEIGEQITTESPWTTVRKIIIEQDIDANEKSDFVSVQDDIRAYAGEDILVGYHVSSDIPDTFYVCLRESSKAEIENMIEVMEMDRKDKVNKMLERYAGQWESLGSENEIDSWKIELGRPLLEVDVQINTSRLRKLCFKDVDAHVEKGGYVKVGPSRIIPTNIRRLRLDAAIQACPENTFSYAQTYLPFPKNAWTQYLYEVNASDTVMTEVLKDKLNGFLERSYGYLEPVIAYNAHFDLYRDDYIALIQSDRDLAKSKEILFKSFTIFVDVIRCKNKYITACDWHPMWSGVVAMAYAEKMRSLCVIGDEREEGEIVLSATGSSPALIWSFVDELSPKLILECPHQIHALRFCPHNENLLIGGCINGQVVLWDLTDRLRKVEYEEILTDEQRYYHANLNKHMTWMKRTSFDNIVRTSVMSSLEFSPQSCITDVQWLSPYAQLKRNGRYEGTESEQNSLQFASASEDGLICIWDLKMDPNIKKGPVKPHKKKRRNVPEDLKLSASKFRDLNLTFSPIFKIHVKDGMDAGEIRLTFMTPDFFPLTFNLCKALVPHKELNISDRLIYTPSFQQPAALPRSEMFLGTIEGHALHVAWEGYEFETGEAVTSEICKYLSFNDGVHDSPVSSISRSPYITDLILTVSARVFAIWSEDFKDKPLLWRKSHVRMSCGRWSLYRPSSFVICRHDGCIITWDLLIRSNGYVKEQAISGSFITSMYSSKIEPLQHVVGLADFMGGFRIYMVPSSYLERDAGDEIALKHFFTRELDAHNALQTWSTQWLVKNAAKLEAEKAAMEEEEQRQMEEEEKIAKEVALKKTQEEEELLKKIKQEQKISWSERYQKKWEEVQESNMMKIIMNLKHFKKSELLEKLQPLEALHEEEEQKKLKQKERLNQAQKMFEDLVYLLFPGTLDSPLTVSFSAEIMFVEIEEITNKLLDVYHDLETEALSYIEQHEFIYDFSWRRVLNEGLERRKILNEFEYSLVTRDERYEAEKLQRAMLSKREVSETQERAVVREESQIIPEYSEDMSEENTELGSSSFEETPAMP